MTTINATMDHMHMGNLASSNRASEEAVKPKKSQLAATESGESDEKLLMEVGNHQSREAFNKLFERFSNKIFLHGMKITRNEQLSKDLVQ